MGNFKVSLAAIFICGCFELQSVNGWSNPFGTDPDDACSTYNDAPYQLYRDAYPDKHYQLACLDREKEMDPETFGIWTRRATKTCIMSACYATQSDNHCPVRNINGTDYRYDEINRDTCTPSREGDPGYTSLCCLENSDELQLAVVSGAEPHEFPHITKLSLHGQCGGTIYNERFIITAAHCIVNEETHAIYDERSDWHAIIGTNSADVDDEEHKYKVLNVIPHPEYSQLAPHHTKYAEGVAINDIALLELDRDIKFVGDVKSLEIAPKDFEPRDYADNSVVAGWGVTPLLEGSLNLLKFNFQLRNGEDCFVSKRGKKPSPWGYFKPYKQQLLCVGGYINNEHGPVAGKGDSGGPAVCRGADGRALLCGVTSFGGSDKNCTEQPGEEFCPPSVYARVSYFHDWIKDNAKKQNIKTFYKPYLYGEPVSAKRDYKYHVHITSDGKPCGGTLVAPDVVVTAASCVADVNGALRSGVKVIYGMEDLTSDSGVQTFDVKDSDIKIMDGYHVSGDQVDESVQGTQAIKSDNIYKNNLAVIKLDGKAPVDPDDLPKLPQQGQTFTAAKELAYPRNTTHGGKLLLRDYRVLTKRDCQNRLDRLSKRQGAQGGGDSTQIDETNLCGVEVYSGGSICDRELGGGLICEGNVLCGVQSFRLCRWSFPGIFVDMSGKAGTWAKDAIK